MLLYNNPYGIKNRQSQSIILSQKGGFDSSLLSGQMASISQGVAAYHPEDFKYTIKLENGSEIPSTDSIEGTAKLFSTEDKLRMVKTMIEAFPNLANEKLIELSDELEEKVQHHSKNTH